jgi:MFS family permease
MNKNIYYLGLVSFFTDFASAMITPVLPIFIVYILNDGVDKLGVVIASATFISYIFRILFGYLSDRFQIRKPFLIVGYLISAISKPLLAFSNTYQSVALLRSVERMGKAVRSASKDSLISTYSKKNESGKTFGFHKMMDIAGELFGAITVFCIFYFYGTSEDILRNIFFLTIIPGVIGVLIVSFFLQNDIVKSKAKKYQFEKEDFKLFPTLFFYFCFIFFMMGDSFYIIVAKEDGYLISFIPIFIIVLTLTQTLTSYYFGVMSDKKGSYQVLRLAYLAGIASIIAMGLGYMWIGFIFLGIFTVASLNAIRSYISVNAINKASIYGVFYGGIAIFSSLGALCFGYIWQNFGQNSALMFSLCGTVFVSLLSIIFKNKISKES